MNIHENPVLKAFVTPGPKQEVMPFSFWDTRRLVDPVDFFTTIQPVKTSDPVRQRLITPPGRFLAQSITINVRQPRGWPFELLMAHDSRFYWARSKWWRWWRLPALAFRRWRWDPLIRYVQETVFQDVTRIMTSYILRIDVADREYLTVPVWALRKGMEALPAWSSTSATFPLAIPLEPGVDFRARLQAPAGAPGLHYEHEVECVMNGLLVRPKPRRRRA
jgi:hypothetical protein